MPNLAANHPQVVHFAIALCLIGVAFRLISLTGRLTFTKHAASVLLILAAVSGWVSVKSGLDAHGPVERIPGVRAAVQEHEELGIEARNIVMVVGVLEIAALALAAGAATAPFTKWAYVASALVGIYGSIMVVEAGEHGGQIVYNFGGGPGLRRGDTTDISRALNSALYNQAMASRRAKNGADAAKLIAELAQRNAADTSIRLLAVESLLLDSHDGAAAVKAAREVAVDEKDPRMATRKAGLLADAFLAQSMPDSAKAVLQPVVAAFPQSLRLKAKLDSIH